jgi:hypothetical protein
MSYDVEALMNGLVSEDMERQTSAIEAAGKLIQQLAEQAVRGLAVSSSPVITTDWLSRLGPVLIPSLEKFVDSAAPGEKRVAAGCLLLYLGSQKGVKDVLDELRSGGPNEFLAANKLVKAKIPEAPALIIERLRQIPESVLFDESQSPYVYGFLRYLEESGTPLPPDLKQRFTRPGVPEYISGVIK